MLKFADLIRDPIHGYVHFTEMEEAVINCPFFQRLRLIKQTPGASWVYPGANHTRFEHSLGTMQLAGELATQLLHRDERWSKLPEDEKGKRVQKARLCGLLHDIGHGPFSHVFEEFLLEVEAKVNHELIGEKIIRETVSPIILKNISGLQWDKEDIEDMVGWLNETRYGLGSVVTESINVDVLDYLVRDAYHTGTLEYGLVDMRRIIENVNVCRLFPEERQNLKGTGTILLREKLKREKIPDENLILTIDERAIIAVESFFVSRLEMYNAVYYHRTVRAIQRGLVSSMQEIVEEVPNLKMFKKLSPEDLKTEAQNRKFKIDDFLRLNDYSVLADILGKNCKDFNSILRRKQKRMALEKPEAVTSDELAEYSLRLERRHELEKKIRQQLSAKGLKKEICESIALDVPFPLLPIRIGRIYVKYRENGAEKISTIIDYGKKVEKCPPILKLMVKNDLLRMIDQKVFADTEDDRTLEKIGGVAREVLGGGGAYPIHI